MRRLLLALGLLAGPALAACPSQATMEANSQGLLAGRPQGPIAGLTSLADGQCAQSRLVPLLVALLKCVPPVMLFLRPPFTFLFNSGFAAILVLLFL